MKFANRIISAFSAAALLAVVATGCTATTPTSTTPGTTPVSTPAVRPDYIPEDIVLEAAGIARDTAIITVDGTDVAAEDVLYWLSYTADQYAQYSGGAIDWTQDMEGTTLKDYMLTNAIQTATLYQTVENHAKELGFDLTAENKAAYESELATMKEQLAAQMGAADQELAYMQWLARIGLSDEGFARINKASYLFQNIREGMFGAQGKEAPTAESVAAWQTESGTLRAKHILVKAVASEDGKDDGMAAALEKANTLRAELKAAGDTEVKFDEVMNASSDDVSETGAPNCPPEGYTFAPGEMVEEFYDGTKAIKEGEVSAPVKSSFGYHIIFRLDTKDAYADDKTNALVDSWMTAAKVVHTDAYEKLDVEAYYTKLGALRATMNEAINPTPLETPAVTTSVAPTTTP